MTRERDVPILCVLLPYKQTIKKNFNTCLVRTKFNDNLNCILRFNVHIINSHSETKQSHHIKYIVSKELTRGAVYNKVTHKVTYQIQ